ncbi:Uncharacterised protein [Staphylococcus aureus]|nr:Uncharacterised protein [Staphylococcus aureus]
MAVMKIIIIYGDVLNSPFKPTNGATAPPKINWNKPSKLDALPLPPVRSSIAIVKPSGPIDVTGHTFKKNAMSKTQSGKWNVSVRIIKATPTTCIIVKMINNMWRCNFSTNKATT